MTESSSPSMRGRLGLILAASLLLIAVACTDDPSTTPSPSTTDPSATSTAPDASATPSGTATSTPSDAGADAARDGRVAGSVDAFEVAGIQVVDDGETVTGLTSPVLLTRTQADRMLADVRPDAGVLGADLDALAPMPAGVPPMSYFVASWVTTGDTIGAATAREWMGEQDWVHASEVRWPDAVVVLFVHDAAVAADAGLAPGTVDDTTIDLSAFLPLGPEPVTPLVDTGATDLTAPGPAASGFRATRSAPTSGPCTTVVNFVGLAMGAIVNALHVTPIAGGGALVDVGNFFVGLFNGAVALAAGVIQGIVDTITAPVFAALRVGIGAIAISTIFVSLFRDLRVTVLLEPGQGAKDYHFAVDAGTDVSGQFVATSQSLTGEWPDLLVDCANAIGMPLPEATGKGAKATWAVEQGEGLIVTSGSSSVVGDDLAARLDFTTGREPADSHAKGDAANGNVFVRVKIPRKAVDDLLRFGRDAVVSAKQTLLSRVPLAPLRSAVDAALSSVIDPTLRQLESELAGAAGGRFTLTGIGLVNVSFHTPPTTTTSIPPTTEVEEPEDGEFCRRYRALVDFTAATFDDDGDVQVWAQEIVRQLQEMRPFAPPAVLADVDVLIGPYQVLATTGDVLALIDATLPLGDASARVGAFCGLTPG